MKMYLLLPVYALATYRLAIMLSSDLGPYGIFQKIRTLLKREAKQSKSVRESKVHLGIQCHLCTSVWIAFPIAAYAYFHKQLPPWFAACGDVFLFAMALSALAIIANRAFPPKP